MTMWSGMQASPGAMNPNIGLAEQAIQQAYSPRQLFGQFASGYSPDVRRGLWSYQRPMEALWRLGGVGVPGTSVGSPMYAANPYSGDFGQFVRNVPGGMPGQANVDTGFYGGRDAMLQRAREAARVGAMTGAGFDTAYSALAGSPERQAELGRTRERYGTGDEAYSNQLAAAQALALMRAGGGMYGGETRRGIESALSEIQASRAARGFTPGSFLEWYTGTQQG
jgi:hypothetical protein